MRRRDSASARTLSGATAAKVTCRWGRTCCASTSTPRPSSRPTPLELVPDEPPSRDELHALISAGWDAFAAEIGLAHVHAVAPNPAPGIDLLAVDTDDGRPVDRHGRRRPRRRPRRRHARRRRDRRRLGRRPPGRDARGAQGPPRPRGWCSSARSFDEGVDRRLDYLVAATASRSPRLRRRGRQARRRADDDRRPELPGRRRRGRRRAGVRRRDRRAAAPAAETPRAGRRLPARAGRPPGAPRAP